MPTPPSSGKLSAALRRVLILLTLSVFLNYIDRGSLSIAAPLVKDELGLSPWQLGLLLSSFFWTYTAFQIPAGWLVDRFDVGWVLAFGFFVWTGATAITGAMHAFAALLVVRLILGFGEAVAYPSYSKILARDFSARHRGLANGAIAAGQTSGPAVGTFVGGMLMAQFGWRPFFIGLGLLSLLWLIPWIIWRPRTHVPIRRRSTEPLPGLLEILVQRSCWGACIGHFSGNYLIYFLLTWMPFYLVRERNFSMNSMARIGGVAFLLCALSSLVSGPLTDRWIVAGASPTRVRKTMLVVGLAGAGLLLVLCVIATPALSVALLLASSTFYGLCNPHIFASAQALAGPNVAGKWMGLQNFIGNFAGIVAPALTGLLVQKTSHFFWAFAVTGIVTLIGSLSWIYVVGPIEEVAWRAANGRT
ncbi:MAG TPA: MFS transporter [Candidatus Acidoferrum sp.]|nr:MFS transporter [Candidatus Acidoferrum sp.]